MERLEQTWKKVWKSDDFEKRRISHEEAYRRFGGTANEKLNGGWK